LSTHGSFITCVSLSLYRTRTGNLFDMHQLEKGLHCEGLELSREVAMSENIKSKTISRRRALSLMGLVAGLSIIVPAAVITATDAEAVVGQPGSPVSVAGANRRDRRDDRRSKKKKKKKKAE
jgi:hypothetical protein